MPQFIWEGLFQIINVLVPGVVLVLFAAYYQNRRKREIQIEGKVAVERIDGYEHILACLYEGQNLHEVSLIEEANAKAILSHFDIETFSYQCPDAFRDEASFEAFYKRLLSLQKDYQIYLDDEASIQLNKSVGIYTRFKNWMDAFCDTEHTVDLKITKTVAKKNIDWTYKLLGMMMFSHCTRAYVQMDEVVCKQMNRFYLTYRKHRIRKMMRKMGERIIHVFEVNMSRKGIRGKLSRGVIALWIGKVERNFSHIMEVSVEVMRYVHFSDRYSPQEYFEKKNVPSNEEMALFGQVFMAMVHKS